MKLYHGSNVVVQTPDPFSGRKKLDFGPGFYTTTLAEQAEQWALRTALQRDNNKATATVSVYEFQYENQLILKSFNGYDEEWLLFVCNNRRSDKASIDHGFDIIFGHIADDRVIETVDYFIEQLMAGRASQALVTLTIEQLALQQPNDQFCFASSRLNEVLTFDHTYKVQS
ncbi:MAG: DUF3990 domain-containing protein [Coriobacteriales bacterium]|jgi:hypothetical protein|nr:DUF3990 domain-containing protein [Coriobacteriales bacterium]